MKLSINWLNDYLRIGADPKEIANRLTAVGHMEDCPSETVGGDTILSLEVRQNRPDCLSITGLARELGAIYGKKIALPKVVDTFVPKNQRAPIEIEIEDTNLCYRFNTLIIKDISVGPTPSYIKERVKSCGIKSLNNLVDITNFVMLEFGQPLHAFDLEKIRGGNLLVRPARKGERLVVLGGKEINLTPADLIITDDERPLALAGIIGGEGSGVSEKTEKIVLEAANYNQTGIRRSARRHNLRTEASTRLEKFLHPKVTKIALVRAAKLISEICGGRVVAGLDVYPNPKGEVVINFPLGEISRLGGLELNRAQVKTILEGLELEIIEENTTTLKVKIPYFRTDLEQSVDLVEEIARIYGYDRIPQKLPSSPPPLEIASPTYVFEEEVRDILVALGFNEQITEPLTNEKDPEKEPVTLENSLSREKSMLRTQMESSLLVGLSTYRKHKRETVRLFEIGKIYLVENGESRESGRIAAILSGPKETYRTAKGVAELLFPTEAVKIKRIKNEFPTFFFSLKTEKCLARRKERAVEILTTVPQIILEDLSIVVSEQTPVGDLIRVVEETSELIKEVELGDVYQDVILRKAKEKSVFLKIIYRSPDQVSLSDKDIKPVREKVVKKLEKEFSARLRGK